MASDLWTVFQGLGHLVQRTKEEHTKSSMKEDFTQNQNENNKGTYQESVADSEHLVTVCDFLVWVQEKGQFIARGKAWVVSCLIDKHRFLGISSLHVLFLTMYLNVSSIMRWYQMPNRDSLREHRLYYCRYIPNQFKLGQSIAP